MTTLSVAAARANFSKLVESAASTHERFDVTKNGARVAVLLGADDYDSLIETLEILGDPAAMADLRESEADIAAGRTSTLDEVKQALRARGRL